MTEGSPRGFDGPDSTVRTLLDRAAAAVVAVDAQGRIGYVNAVVEATLGYAPAELLGRQVEDLLPAASAAAHELLREDYVALPAPRQMLPTTEVSARHKDGRDIPVEVHLTPLTTETGQWVVAGLTDISVRRAAQRRVDALSRAYLTLAHMNQAVVQARDRESLLHDICRVAVKHGGFLAAWIGEVEDGMRLRVVARAGAVSDVFDSIDFSLDPSVPTGQGPAARAVRERRPVYVEDFLQDPGTRWWKEHAAERGIVASVALPLSRGGAAVGALNLYSGDTLVFDDEMREVLEQEATCLSHAMDSFDNIDRLRTTAAHRRSLLRRLVTAEEQERARIAADVHDESVQALAAVDLRLGLLRRQIREVAPELEPSVVQVLETLGAATGSLRQLLFDLEPADVTAGLPAIVREAAEQLFENQELEVQVEADDVKLPELQLGQAVRITKEALINIRKHASARSATIELHDLNGGVEIAISDDGTGFEAGHGRVPGHRGLATMAERAEVSGGWLRVESMPGHGTTVRFWLPSVEGWALG